MLSGAAQRWRANYLGMFFVGTHRGVQELGEGKYVRGCLARACPGRTAGRPGRPQEKACQKLPPVNTYLMAKQCGSVMCRWADLQKYGAEQRQKSNPKIGKKPRSGGSETSHPSSDLSQKTTRPAGEPVLRIPTDHQLPQKEGPGRLPTECP